MLDMLINTRLISHPLNWLIVFAFVMIWGVVLTTAHNWMQSGSCGCDNGYPD